LPNYREFYEYRQFAPAAAAFSTAIAVLDQGEIPFGEHLIFQCQEHAQFTFFLEICEDLWVPIPPSCHAALAGATVILNLSASNITIAKDEYRHSLVSNQSARCLAGYLYTAAGTGESTTDLAWDGHAMVYENGDLIAESERFRYESQLIIAELIWNGSHRSECARIASAKACSGIAKNCASSEGFNFIPSFRRLADYCFKWIKRPGIDASKGAGL